MYFSKIRSDVVENTEVEKALEKVTYKCNSTPKAIDSNYCVIAHVSPFSPSNLPNPLGLIQTSFHSYSNPFCLWVFVLVAVRRPSHKERALGYDIKGIVNKPSSEIHPPQTPPYIGFLPEEVECFHSRCHGDVFTPPPSLPLACITLPLYRSGWHKLIVCVWHGWLSAISHQAASFTTSTLKYELVKRALCFFNRGVREGEICFMFYCLGRGRSTV